MLGVSRPVLVVLALAAAAITTADASARIIRRSCRDAVMSSRADAMVSCDVDLQCDGVCSFEVPVCDASSCRPETFTVPARTTQRVDVAVEPGAAPAKLVLHCRPAPRFVDCTPIATTTSTTAPAHAVTTTTRRRLVLRTTSTSSTSTSTSSTAPTSTSTTIITIPCGRDPDCDGLASTCSVGVCGVDALCVRICVCVTPRLDRTCSIDDATQCLLPDDCPAADDAACRVCYLNRCVTSPAPSCFF